MLRSTQIEENVTTPLLIKKGACIYGGCMIQVSKADGLLKIYDCGAVGDIADTMLIDIVGVAAASEGMNRTKAGMQFPHESYCISVTNGIVAEIAGSGTLGVVAFK